jgi:hypothetical protein
MPDGMIDDSDPSTWPDGYVPADGGASALGATDFGGDTGPTAGGGGPDLFDLASVGAGIGALALSGSGGTKAAIAGGFTPANQSTFTIGGPNGLNYSSGGLLPVAPGRGTIGVLRKMLPRGTTVRGFLTAVAKLGLQGVAAALGIPAGSAAQLYVAAKSRPSVRRRGITGRQLSNAGKVLRKLAGMNRQVSKYTSSFRHSPHAAAHHTRKGKR